MPARSPIVDPARESRTAEPLLRLLGAARQRSTDATYYYDAGARIDPRHVVLQLTLSGVGFHRRAGHAPTPLPAGHAMLEMIPGPFEYGWAGGVYDFVFISITGSTAMRWAHEVHTRYGRTLDVGNDAALAQTMLALARSARRGTLQDEYLLSAQLYGLMMQLMSVLARKRIATTPLIARCLQIIQTDAARPDLNVNTLAARLDCSREHLTRTFRQATGVPPLTYLTRARVRLAGQALRGSPKKLDAVAQECGFGSSAYLCRIFQRIVGVTPKQYRDRTWLVTP